MRTILVSLMLMFVISGCTTAPLQVSSKPVDRVPLILPNVDRYYNRNVEWVVITPANAEKVFAKLKKEGKPIAVIGLSGQDYKALSLNTADTQVLIKQLQSLISAYKKYYIAVEKKADDTDKKNLKENP